MFPKVHGFTEGLKDYGFTQDCPQCEHIQKYNVNRPGFTHTDACRQRITEAMTATPEGQQRIKKYELVRLMRRRLITEAHDGDAGRPALGVWSPGFG